MFLEESIYYVFLILVITLKLDLGYAQLTSVSSPDYGPTGCGRFETKHKTNDLRTLGRNKVSSFSGNADIITSPYLALLGYRQPDGKPVFSCVGSLISDQWVLTAAHCGAHSDITSVRLGEHDLENSPNLPLEYPLEFTVAEKHIHPGYIKGQYHDDLLLIKLFSKVPSYRYDIRPICLPWGVEAHRTFMGYRLMQEGWPLLVNEGKIGPTPSSSFMTMVTVSSCISVYGKSADVFRSTHGSKSIVCAKTTEKTVESTQACSHLSGTPLTYLSSSGQETMVGFLTLGFEQQCKLENSPNIYMSTILPQNLLWIKNVAFSVGPGTFSIEGHTVTSFTGGLEISFPTDPPGPTPVRQTTPKPELDNSPLKPVAAPLYGSYKCGVSELNTEFKDIRELYEVNNTAKLLLSQGYEVVPLEVTVDRLESFWWKNNTHSGIYSRDTKNIIKESAKLPANRRFTLYMAILGYKNENNENTTYFCGGMLLNRQWVLTAAHCLPNFVTKNKNTIVRLGDYNHQNKDNLAHEYPLDFETDEKIPHPLYREGSVAYDLGLVKLKKKVPYFRYDIRPVCLPWGDEIFKDNVGSNLTVTGWGSITHENAQITNRLLEVNVTVFSGESCHEFYKKLGLQKIFPSPSAKGSLSYVMCAGDPLLRPQADACQGDSGSPAVYLDSKGRFTALGIVSSGYRCTGEVPGLYTPLNNHLYLQWIKDFAFNDTDSVITVTVLSENVKRPEKVTEGCGIPQVIHDIIDYRDAYHINTTAETLEKQGFEIIPLDMTLDRLDRFIYRNGTFQGEIFRGQVNPSPFTGKIPARRVASLYMVLMMERGPDSRKLTPFCGGALLNRGWVLTAAHCFIFKNLDIVRLGEYNFANAVDLPQENPIEVEVEDIIFHPSYKLPVSYHDLALVRLKTLVPHFRFDIRPLCLPWGKESTRTHVGKEVTLTGWGATFYRGPSTAVLQEVNLTVFPTEVCQASYSRNIDFNIRYPQGLSPETSLCAGGKEGAKDACGGDSGGPIVYLNDEGRYTVAGIVSVGYGCGNREFPTIFIPINNPTYLEWIRQVAFSN